MVKSKLQIAIILLGFISYSIAVWTLFQIPTVFVYPLHLVLTYTVALFVISYGLGLLARKILKSNWYSLTFASIFTIVFAFIFYVSQHRPQYEIIIPDNYTGNEIKLIVSKEPANDFQINSFGVGYINKKTFEQNFIPVAIKNGQNILISGLTRYSNVSISKPKLHISLDYIQFEIPGKIQDWKERTIEALIERNAIDTTRMNNE